MFFKLTRKIYRFSSPALCLCYNMLTNSTLGAVKFIGLPVLKGKILIKSGILVSMYNGNPLGIIRPCRLIADDGIIEIGDNFSASGVVIFSSTCVKIGDNVMIGINVLILDDDMHSTDFFSRRANMKDSRSKPIEIKDDVWIGANVIILKGVVIGERSIIGAGCIVSRDVPADSVVTPASYILHPLKTQANDNSSLLNSP